MSDPAVDAAQRATAADGGFVTTHDIAAAREALKPVRAWFRWWSHTHQASLPDYAWDHLAQALFSTEELA